MTTDNTKEEVDKVISLYDLETTARSAHANAAADSIKAASDHDFVERRWIVRSRARNALIARLDWLNEYLRKLLTQTGEAQMEPFIGEAFGGRLSVAAKEYLAAGREWAKHAAIVAEASAAEQGRLLAEEVADNEGCLRAMAPAPETPTS